MNEINFMYKKYFKVIIRDFSFFGSLTFYLFVMFLFLFLFDLKIFLFLFISLILIYFLVFLIRSFYFKKRPNKVKFDSYIGKIRASSFPSGHSMRSTVLLVCILFEFTFNLFLSLFLLFIFSGILFSRWYQKKHYFLDILVGTFLGILIYLLVYWFFIFIF